MSLRVRFTHPGSSEPDLEIPLWEAIERRLELHEKYRETDVHVQVSVEDGQWMHATIGQLIDVAMVVYTEKERLTHITDVVVDYPVVSPLSRISWVVFAAKYMNRELDEATLNIPCVVVHGQTLDFIPIEELTLGDVVQRLTELVRLSDAFES